MRYIFPKWTAEGAGNCGELSPHSILQRRAYVSCRGCVGIPPSAWGRSHEVRVAPRIKGLALFVLDRRRFLLSGAFFFYTPPAEAPGFLYIVSSLGVTGTRSEIKTDLAAIVKVVRENTKTPSAIGFGISTPEQAAKMAGIADGAIVGSAIIKLLEQYGTAAPEQIGAYVKRMKDAVRG